MLRILHISSQSTDTESVREKFELTGENVEITSAESISEALEEASKSSYDYVLYESGEGGVDGLSLLRNMRNRNIETPLLFSSPTQLDPYVEHAFEQDNDVTYETVKKGGKSKTIQSLIKDRLKPGEEESTSRSFTSEVNMNVRNFMEIVDFLPDAIIVLDRTSKITYVNEATISLFKCSSEKDLIGYPILKLFSLAYNNAGLADVRTLLSHRGAQRHNFHWKMVNSDDDVFYADAIGFHIGDVKNPLTAIIIQKINLSEEIDKVKSKPVSEIVQPPKKKKTFLVVCDGLVMKSGLQLLLGDEEDNYIFVEYSETSLDDLPVERSDAVIFARSTLDKQGLEELKSIIARSEGLPVLLTALTGEQITYREALTSGIAGVINSEKDFNSIPNALSMISEGATWFSQKVLKESLLARGVQSLSSDPQLREFAKLTKREKQVLGMLAEGFKNKIIAEKLGLSYRTVVTHVYNIYRKLKITSRTEAIHFAITHRMMEN